MEGIFSAWGRILQGYRPALSVEITRECPLRCPGCYAYGDEHLGGAVTLRQVRDFKGQELVDRFLALVDEHRPLHVSIVGGEPLVRFRELDEILPVLARRGIYTQVVTSAVRPIPIAWAALPRLQVVVSIDGLQPEHDARRTPATYDRILKHIAGHQIVVHCTVTRQQVQRDGYIDQFVDYWSGNPHTRNIWVSLYTPQVGETSVERLEPSDRERVVAALMHLRGRYPKLRMPARVIEVLQDPPQSPAECIFAQTTTCISADFEHRITPCQFGGTPDCANCGCHRLGWPSAPVANQVSFDITSGVDLQEVDNAVNQARKEVAQRYDFKGSRAAIEFSRTENTLTLVADDEFKLSALWEILQGRMVRRGVPTKNLTPGDIERAANDTVRRVVSLQQGIPSEAAREIVKFLKDHKLKKVQAAIQADQVRVSSASKDDLQEAIRLLREHDFGVALQFGNYRG
jgi:uncharacterized protein YajQ (UPF0234 family)/MoaA/NifB/PqqE/SkfB family radical SAM enzyme